MDVATIFFSARQQAILWLMYEEPDLSHEGIAARLGITRAGVEQHLALMKDRLSVRTDTGLIVTLCKEGWFDNHAAPADELPEYPFDRLLARLAP